jgi:Uma2 family endonuclease
MKETSNIRKVHPQRTAYLTLSEFEIIAEDLPDRRFELIKGELKVAPVPEPEHQRLACQVSSLFAKYYAEIEALSCLLSGACIYFELPVTFQVGMTGGPSMVNPDAAICFEDFLTIQRCPPALLVAEVLSLFSPEIIDRDLIIKPEIYAALKIPNYWVIDWRDQSVHIYQQPQGGAYRLVQIFHEEELLPVTDLEFLQITPAQIFAA